jgi:hypothetical protein
MTDTSPTQIRFHGPTYPSYEPDTSTDKCFKARRSVTSHRPPSTHTAQGTATGLVRATADNRRRTGHAARRERCHTEPGVGRDGHACARLATAGGPPRGAPEDGLLQARGEAQSGLARGSQIGAGKARAEAGESLEAGLDGAESPAPEADRPSGRRAARWKECSTLRAAAGWVRRWSSGCGAGARASNRAPCTSYGSAPPKLSVGSGAPWTSTVRL